MLPPEHLTEIKGTPRIETHMSKENLRGDNRLEILWISGQYKLEEGLLEQRELNL